MPRLYHPDLDRWHDVPSERAAAVYQQSGWLTETEVSEAQFFLAAAGLPEGAPQEVTTTDVGGDESPENETPDTQEE